MNAIARLLAIAAIAPLGAACIAVHAKGSVGGKISGWTAESPSTLAGLGGTMPSGVPGQGGKNAPRNSAVSGFSMPNANTGGMSGLLITPNGMIAHNMPPMSVPAEGNLTGSSEIAKNARGVGNSRVDPTSGGAGNSQGAGGTLVIAQMTHFGVAGMAAVSSLISAGGVNVSSAVSRMLSTSGVAAERAGSTLPGTTSGSPKAGAKAGLVAPNAKNACGKGASADMTCG